MACNIPDCQICRTNDCISELIDRYQARVVTEGVLRVSRAYLDVGLFRVLDALGMSEWSVVVTAR